MNCDTWPIPEAGLCVGGCTIPEDVDEEILEAASIKAGAILYTLSGHRVGLCVDTIRPLPECGTCTGKCYCTDAGDRIKLYSTVGPISSVGEIDIDGEVLDTTEYRFYPSGQTLYRRPPGVWPSRDLKWAECGEPDTMCVQVVIGSTPDAWALSVHAELVCELVASCTGQKCRIPRNASQVNGQGVTITLTPTEAQQFIPAVAGWVAAVNPNNAQDITRVFSPDLHPTCGVQGGGIPGGEVGPFPPWIIDGGGP
jgi:hypothetical protein